MERARRKGMPPQSPPIPKETLTVISKQLGALPVIKAFLDRLNVTTIVDEACPVANQAELTHGQVITAMVANRLTSPEPLVHVEDWAQAWAVPEVFGLPAHLLNDDRLGRALDAIQPQIESLKGSVAWAAIDAFGIDTAVFHWDFTSLSFFGAYDDEQQSPNAPRVTYGHSKAKRPDLKQLMVGLASSADGCIPFNPTVRKGSAAEVAEVVPAMLALKQVARQGPFILVGDTKVISRKNILAACREGVAFCAPAPASDELDRAFLQIPRETFARLQYLSERDSQLPVAQQTVYLGCERPWVVTDLKTRQSYSLRRVFVISSEEQQACRKNRARQLDKAEATLRKIQNNLGTRYYPTPADVRLKATKAVEERRVQSYFRFHIDGEDGAPTFTWERDPEAIAAAERLDGYYVLVTNLPAEQYSVSGLLRLYKEQYKVERRYKDFKGPLAVSPLFLKNNQRLHALVFVIYLALLVFCLLEREARRAVADMGGRIRGYYPENRKVRPTGQNLLRVLRWLAVAVEVGPDGSRPLPPVLTPQQQLVHDLLGVPEPFTI